MSESRNEASNESARGLVLTSRARSASSWLRTKIETAALASGPCDRYAPFFPSVSAWAEVGARLDATYRCATGL